MLVIFSLYLTVQLLIYSMTLFNHINNKIVEIPSTLPEETLLVTTLQCSNVEIKCDFQEEDYNGIIYWIIGGLIYDPNNNFYPSTSFNNSDTLLVLNADSNYHNTTFQCFYLTPSDQVLGTEIRLVVLESKSLMHFSPLLKFGSRYNICTYIVVLNINLKQTFQ